MHLFIYKKKSPERLGKCGYLFYVQGQFFEIDSISRGQHILIDVKSPNCLRTITATVV